MAAISPLTPERDSAKSAKSTAKDEEIKMIIDTLNDAWDLRLPVPAKESPNKLHKSTEQSCVNLIKFLSYKEEIFLPVKSFREEALRLWKGWVVKPKADRDMLPEATRQKPYPVTSTERTQLLNLLYDRLKDEFEQLKAKNSFTPRTARSFNISFGDSFNKVDDSPVPFPTIPRPNKQDKRAREEPADDLGNGIKKVKTPAEVLSRKAPNSMLPPPRGRPPFRDNNGSRSADQSFDSVTTTTTNTSIFSRGPSFAASDCQNTQETIPDPNELLQTQEITPPVMIEEAAGGSHFSSDYGAGSSFEAMLREVVDTNAILRGSEVASESVDDVLSQDLMNVNVDVNMETLCEGINGEDALQERMSQVFPQLSPSVQNAPIGIAYEVTRVCQHTGTSMLNFDISTLDLTDYDSFWQSLKRIPSLKGKQFPEKSERSAWQATQGDFSRGSHAVILSGSLKTNNSTVTGPLFDFRLNPLRLDRAHRLGHRHGHHRFLEFDMPHLTGDKLPKAISGLPQDARNPVLGWLVDGKHMLFGRSWKPYHTKPRERKHRKRDDSKDDSETAHVVFFFAVDGNGIDLAPGPPSAGLTAQRLEIHELLETVRLIRKNDHQPYLKLFARTSLAVSRNSATVVLEPEQILYEDDIEYKGEVMTDGAGLISPSLAYKINDKLDLLHKPAGFQGRIGQAKGFWTVDWSKKSDPDWIRIYKSQCKWVRSKSVKNPDWHPCNRTFEVLKPSGPLKSADINLQFLPLLMDRASDRKQMKASLANLLEESLQRELDELLGAMDSGPALRKWTHERKSNFKERLKHGLVPFRGGSPITLEEELTMYLDAGFEPKKLRMVADLAKTLFDQQCNEMKKRLNITIRKSTYVYMVPDFWDVLEADEVFINFSEFSDDDSGCSDIVLDDVDVLVARSPAHFNSDIQKVKAVFKKELMRLKDVIVFPVKGNPSLANKLSGGDYDGDLAWLCWEPLLVDNFVNADPPKQPDLVREGYIHQDKTTYADLVKDLPAKKKLRTSHFLKESFAFNMQQSMLGIATSWKERVCYTDDSIATEKAVYLSTLLSSLVDQPKQGYTFTESDWTRFKEDEKIKSTFREPEYKKKDPIFKQNMPNVIDYLFWKVETEVEKCKIKFYAELPKDIPDWDGDLEKPYKWARAEEARARAEAITIDAEQTRAVVEWTTILNELQADLEAVKDSWSAFWHKQHGKADKSFSFSSKADLEPLSSSISNQNLIDHYERYQAIRPHASTQLTRSLLPDFCSETSQWALLKASAVFHYWKRASFPWAMAGNQLARLKAYAKSGGVLPHTLTPRMYVMYKPNNTYIKRARGEGVDSELDLHAAVGNVDELEAVENDG